MPGNHLSPQFFLVRITADLGDGTYTFVELWRSGGSYVEKVGGRRGTATNPSIPRDGVTFDVGDDALCRSAAGEGGLVWESLSLSAGGGTGAGRSPVEPWIAGLI